MIPPWCVYDNPNTCCREYWLAGEKMVSINWVLFTDPMALKIVLGRVPAPMKIGPFHPGQFIGTLEAMEAKCPKKQIEN